MKILSLLFLTLVWGTPLYAETVSVLTELEQVQEKLWYLQSNMAEHTSALETQQQHVAALADNIDNTRTEVDERLTALAKEVAEQQEQSLWMEEALGKLGESLPALEKLSESLPALEKEVAEQQDQSLWMEEALQKLGESLAALADEARLQNDILLEKTEMVDSLEGTVETLQTELKAQQLATSRTLAEHDRRFEEMRAQVDTLGQDMGGRVRQIGYWGGAAALVLVAALIIGFFVRKSMESPI